MNPTSSTATGLSGALAMARSRWQALSDRDRRIFTWAIAAGSVLLFWMLAIQPAWRTLRQAPIDLDRLDVQMQQMNRMAAESQELRGATPVSAIQATASLQSATQRLGTQGRLMIQGDRVTLTLTNISPEALKDWLSEARSAARARPIEAQLNRSGNGYSGTILLGLGGKS